MRASRIKSRGTSLKLYTGKAKWYKVLEAGGVSPYKATKYNLPKNGKPGEWMPKVPVGGIKCGSSGYYLCQEKDLQLWAEGAYTVYEAEPRGKHRNFGDKSAFEEVRLIRKVGTMTDSITTKIDQWYDYDGTVMEPKLYLEIIKDHSKLVNPNAAFEAVVKSTIQKFKACIKKSPVRLDNYNITDMDVFLGWLICQSATVRKPFLAKNGKRFDLDKIEAAFDN